MNYSQTKMPTAEEIAIIERRAQAMRAEVTARGLIAIGAYIARALRGLRPEGKSAKA